MPSKTGRKCFIKDMFVSEKQCLDRQALQGTDKCEGCEYINDTDSTSDSPRCANCQRPGLCLPAKGLCGNCYNKYRKGEIGLIDKKAEIVLEKKKCTECKRDDVALSPAGVCGACNAKKDLAKAALSSYPDNECCCDLTISIERLKALGPCAFCRKVHAQDSETMTPYYDHIFKLEEERKDPVKPTAGAGAPEPEELSDFDITVDTPREIPREEVRRIVGGIMFGDLDDTGEEPFSLPYILPVLIVFSCTFLCYWLYGNNFERGALLGNTFLGAISLSMVVVYLKYKFKN